MMARLIVLLAKKPGLEVHVFVRGGSGSRSGGGGCGSQAAREGTEERRGDPVEDTLRSRVHHWRQV